jgi:ketosteroid isomerase-like protein
MSDPVKQEVADQVRKYEESLLRGDGDALMSVLAEEFVLVEPTGAVVDRASVVGQIRSGALRYEFIDVKEADVRLYGNAAVATDRTSVKGSNQGFEFSGQYRGVDVFIKRDGVWQCVLTQETTIFRP